MDPYKLRRIENASKIVQIISAQPGWQAIYYYDDITRYDVIAWVVDGIGNLSPAIIGPDTWVEFGLDTFSGDPEFVCLKSPSQSEDWVKERVTEWIANRKEKK